jgi:hypothetical protein
MQALARFNCVALAVAAFSSGVHAADPSGQVSDRIVENWRWTRFWFGKTGIDDYAAGRRVSALAFWNSDNSRPLRGLRSSELGVCLRSCSKACESAGETVEMLRRGDHRWEVTSAGFIDGPKAEVERLKQQIEKAEMFRLQLR